MLALTRPVPDTLDRCLLSHREREPIDVEEARRQHGAYEAVLERAGLTVIQVPAAHDLPDSVFIEDTAVVVDEVAVVARPGAPARRPEVDAVAALLAGHRPLRSIEAPGTLDGGDVLRIGRTVWVGESERTNPSGRAQLAAILEPLGYRVRPVPVRGCLHLKTAVSAVADDRVLLNPAWVDRDVFRGLDVVEVAPDEPHAANVLRLGTGVVMAAGSDGTRRRLEERGVGVETVDISELARAEAGLTCCSVLL